MKTQAVKKGDKYVISGSKCFITNGTYADYFTVFAKTDPEAGHRGISAFVVDADLPGVTVDKKEDKMGQRASNTATISFDEVEIPAENLLGEENKGFKLAMMTLDRTRPGVSAMAVGIGRAALEYATDYSKERVQFGVPIAMHQAIQFMIADMATKVEAGRLLIWNSAFLLDQGIRNSKVSSMAKRFAADSAMEITTDAVQVYGGYGFIKEYPVEKLMRDAKIMQLYEGTSQIQRLVIAKEVLLPRQADDAPGAGGQGARPPSRARPSRQPLRSEPMDAPERAAAGKAARSGARRSSHADWEPSAGRADPVAILERQADSRVPELVPIRYGRMSASPFAFFRGAAAVMAADLAATPISGLRVQACGDAHLSNFGVFAAPDRRLVFDLNDFDETLPGPGSGTSSGWPPASRSPAARTGSSASSGGAVVLTRGAQLPRGDAGLRRQSATSRSGTRASTSRRRWAEIEAEDPKAVKQVRKGVAKARAKDSLRALAEADRAWSTASCASSATRRCWCPVEELLPEDESRDLERGARRRSSSSYRDSLPADRQHLLDGYRFRHIARKVVGVGSVGTRAWVVLLTGADDGDPLFLQAKEAEASVLEPYAGASRYHNHGRRVVEGQRLMQAASDIFLGWCPAVGLDGRDRDFYVRQLWDWKGSAEVETADPARPRDLRADVRLDPGPRPRPLRRPRSRSPPTSAPATPSTTRSPSSPRPTPTRTSATTRRWSRRSTPAASRPRSSERGPQGEAPAPPA